MEITPLSSLEIRSDKNVRPVVNQRNKHRVIYKSLLHEGREANAAEYLETHGLNHADLARKNSALQEYD